MSKISQEKQLWIYRVMNEIRYFEEKAYEFFLENKLRGSVHLYTGEEAVAAAVCSLLEDNDYITSTHRGHGHGIAKSGDLKAAMAELMGKETGFCKGRGGSMHIADLKKGNLGANAIVGAGIPIAVGGALAHAYRNEKNVSIAFFGDGASNQGTFHEGINLAAVWNLPAIFICENNGFGISVPQSQSTSVKDVSVRAKGYDIPGVTVDGNDVYAVYEAAEKAIKRAKDGKGPTLIEAKTYRWRGHWTGDPEVYRTKEDVKAWMDKCPIKRMKAAMIADSIATEKELTAIEEKAKADVEAAAKFAIESPEPDPKTVMDNVYYEEA
jgi:pyruvate dehydrogenase E1 component alpha subunit